MIRQAKNTMHHDNAVDMEQDIPFDRSLQFEYGRVDWLSPRVRRLVARNPGPFTFTGTNTYIVGIGEVAVIDPGPDNAAHLQHLVSALHGEKVAAILVTHTHRDHSPLARQLADIFNAPIYAEGPHRPFRPLREGEGAALEAGADMDFTPDHRLEAGQIIKGPGFTLEAIPTPGHTVNHMAFALAEDRAIFSGDHIMAWSTCVIAPPDGSMTAYMRSLRLLAERHETQYWPGHGGAVTNARLFARAYIKHRLMREAAILRQLEQGPVNIPDLVASLYADLDPRLHRAAGLSVFAHLEALVETGAVRALPDVTLESMFERC